MLPPAVQTAELVGWVFSMSKDGSGSDDWREEKRSGNSSKIILASSCSIAMEGSGGAYISLYQDYFS